MNATTFWSVVGVLGSVVAAAIIGVASLYVSSERRFSANEAWLVEICMRQKRLMTQQGFDRYHGCPEIPKIGEPLLLGEVPKGKENES